MNDNISWGAIEEEVRGYIDKMQESRDCYLSLIHQLNASNDEEKKEKLKYVFSFLNPDRARSYFC